VGNEGTGSPCHAWDSSAPLVNDFGCEQADF
jgi:hypothetical protein